MSVTAPNRARRYAPIGKYDVLAHIATGGMGVIYQAVHQETGQVVALKVLAPELAVKPVLVERFRREANRGMKLRHKYLVTMYEFSEANGIFYLALEYVPGIDLFEHIRRKDKLELDEACKIVRQVTKALVYLHSENVVHRDIKPSNILLKQDAGRLWSKLTDLGLAMAVDEQEYRLTKMHSTVGTVDYMSPEQARDSGSADIRSDIYSLGCTFFHMLAGRPPFAEGGLTERLLKHAQQDVPDLRKFNPRVPAPLALLVRRMLAKKPKDRYQTPAEMLEDLTRWRQAAASTEVVVPELPAAAEPGDYVAFAPGTEPQQQPESQEPPETQHALAQQDSSSEAIETLPGVTEEQRRAAEGQFQRALQVLSSGSENEYGIHLLLNCCTLDPANLRYRKALRRLEKNKFPEPPAGKKGWLAGWSHKNKLNAAKQAGEHLKVLDQGEQLLKDNPWDVGITMVMAESAEALGLTRLAVWLLTQVWQRDTHTTSLDRALANVHEKLGEFAEAGSYWKWVLKADPDDPDARRKVQEMAVQETLVRGNYGQKVDQSRE